LKPVKLVLTHAHIDHILGNAFIESSYKLLPVMHRLELPGLQAAPQYGHIYGINMEESPEPREFLEEGDKVQFGNSSLDVLFTPGHSPGSVSLVSHAQKFIFAGD